MKPILTALIILLLGTLVIQAQNISELPCEKRAYTQKELNECAQQSYEQANTDMNSAYEQLDSALARVGAPYEQKLKDAQQAWLKYRDATCESETALSEGATVFPMAKNYCLASVARERARRLKEMAQGMKGAVQISQQKGTKATVTGTVFYLERIALPPNAVVSVNLIDVSRQDVAAQVVGEQTITVNERQVPIAFEIGYDSQAIDPKHTYAIQARITVEGRLWFASTTAYPVITRGNPVKVDVRVSRVASQ